MKVFLTRKKGEIMATGEFDPVEKTLTVIKGSILSATVAHTEKFRGANSIEKTREGVVKNNTLQKNVKFTSASTAGNFVTGSSTNGLIAWKDEKGRTLKKILTETSYE